MLPSSLHGAALPQLRPDPRLAADGIVTLLPAETRPKPICPEKRGDTHGSQHTKAGTVIANLVPLLFVAEC
jgi:hypothetical protein